MNDLTKVLAKSKVNNVDVEEIRKVLANETLIEWSDGYTRSQVLSDLAKIADASGLHKILSEKGIEGSSAGLASPKPSDIMGALGELQTAAKYAEEGRKVKAVRCRLGTKKYGSEVDIILKDGTFVEFTRKKLILLIWWEKS